MHILVFYNDLDNYPALKKAAKGGICTVCKKPIKENTIAATIDSTLQNNDNSFHTMKNSLSERELEIIKMVGEGKVNKEIAFSLNISVRTVEFHRSRIMRKLKIDRVANLIKMAFCLGLVDIEYHTPEICPFMQEAYKNS
jgi:two-component system response regulator TtrR